jgi:LysR family glycine cleavage system transcriptional activator
MPSRRNPPLIAARAFEAAARHKSFQKAAYELNVTPTAVSHQVKRLEEHIGRPLFLRLNRAVELTETGVSLACKLRNLFAQLEDVLDPEAHQNQSTINISAMPSLAAKWLAQRLPDFEARNPQWRLRLDATDALVDFKSGNVDLALRYGAGAWKDVHARHWMEAKVVAVCSPGLLKRIPLKTPADLRKHTLIHDQTSTRPGTPPQWDAWLKAAKVRNIDATRGPMFSSVYMSLEAALAGHGVALAAAPLVALDIATGRLVQPLDFEMDNPYAFWIVTKAKRSQDDKLRALTNWLVAQASDSGGERLGA